MNHSMIDKPDTTVVTGAAGWLGTALMTSFCATHSPWHRSGRIRALVRTRPEADRLRSLGPNVEPVIADITDLSSIRGLFAGLSGSIDVIHTAGVIHPQDVDQFFSVNTEGTAHMLEAADDAGVRRFVHVSSNSPFGTNSHPGDRFRNDEPYNPYYGYGQSKMQAEVAVFEAVERGLNAVIVRPPWFYGPHQPPRQTTFFQMVRTGKFPVFGQGTQSRSMVFVDNLVQGVVRAELIPTQPGLGWWVADAEPYTITEIVETVGRAMSDEGFEVSPNRVRVPSIVGDIAELADGALQRTGRYNQQIHVLGEMNKNIACDISVTRRDLGYEPEVALHEGMRRSIRWCLDQGLEL